MLNFFQRIEKLIADDKIEVALKTLQDEFVFINPDARKELVLHRAALSKVKKERRRCLIDSQQEEKTLNRICYALLEMLHELSESDVKQSELFSSVDLTKSQTHATTVNHLKVNSPTVFISYSTKDIDVVEKIRFELESEGIIVCIDNQDIQPGERIELFILRAVTESDVVLSIVSRESLISPWVGMESILTLYGEVLKKEPKFIACYLDECFFDVGYRLTITDVIDTKIHEIDTLMLIYAEKRINTDDLNQQKSRLYELRNNLGKILEKLCNTLCLDIREPMWDTNLPRLIASIKADQKNVSSLDH